MMDRIKMGTVEQIFRVQRPQDAQKMPDPPSPKQNLILSRGEDVKAVTVTHKDKPVIGRNDPCVCGSEKKYKRCCGR